MRCCAGSDLLGNQQIGSYHNIFSHVHGTRTHPHFLTKHDKLDMKLVSGGVCIPIIIIIIHSIYKRLHSIHTNETIYNNNDNNILL